MAHFAQLDHKNIVINVIKVNNEDILDSNGIEQENIGIHYLKNIFGENTNWVQTSYSRAFRNYYAGINFSYNQELDKFIPPQPFPSWSIDMQTGEWIAPIPVPDTTKYYDWDEPNQQWIEIDIDQQPSDYQP